MVSRTRTYYCKDCKKTVDFKKGDKEICGCGYMFGAPFNNTKNHVNMRTTWSSQTQVEFNQTTMADDIRSRGGEW